MTESSHYPALSQLESEFNDHMTDFRSGIETSEDLVYWLQRAAVLTLGHIDDDKLTSLFVEPSSANTILLGHPALKPRRDPRSEDLETEADYLTRQKIESGLFNRAFNSAYRQLKTNANEYIDEDSPPAPSDEAPPALRPALQELSDRQREVLDYLFQEGGFADQKALVEWSRDIVAATRAHVSDNVLLSLTLHGRERGLREALFGVSDVDPQTRQNTLQTFAATHLIPMFNKAVRDLAQSAGEQADDGTSSMSETVGV